MLLLRVRCALLHESPESKMMPLISGNGMHCLLRRIRLSHVFAPFCNTTPLSTAALEETEAWDAGTSGEDSTLEEASGGLVKACQLTIDNISHPKEDTQEKKEDHPQTVVATRRRNGLYLSRKERASYVEDFVRKYVSSHQGQFPTVSTVMKVLGGSGPYIKEILTKLEGSLKSIESANETHNGSDSSDEDDFSTTQTSDIDTSVTSDIDTSVSESRPSATAPPKSSKKKLAPGKSFQLAALENEADDLLGALACSTWGKRVSLGTGADFELLWQNKSKSVQKFSYNSDIWNLLSIDVKKEVPIGVRKKANGFLSRHISIPESALEQARHLGAQMNKMLHKKGYSLGDALDEADEKLVLEKILPYHPESLAKIGCGVRSIKIDSHPEHSASRCFFIIRNDATETDFSYHKCLAALEKVPASKEVTKDVNLPSLVQSI